MISAEELEKIPEPLRCNYTGGTDWWIHSRQAKWIILKGKIRDFFLRPKYAAYTSEEYEKLRKEYHELKKSEFNYD